VSICCRFKSSFSALRWRWRFRQSHGSSNLRCFWSWRWYSLPGSPWRSGPIGAIHIQRAPKAERAYPRQV